MMDNQGRHASDKVDRETIQASLGFPLGLYWGYIGIKKKENGNYYSILGFEILNWVI